jgi:hypothetical protein
MDFFDKIDELEKQVRNKYLLKISENRHLKL